MKGSKNGDYWEQPEQVAKFGRREADHRLVELRAEYSNPDAVRVLDLGCAGGRNTEYLVREGFDAYALDASAAMVERTRERLTPLVGFRDAVRRVARGQMTDLSDLEDEGPFHLIVAVGIFHVASSEEEWYRALAEAVRVLAPDGRLLVANFAPGTGDVDAPLRPVPGSRFLFEGFRDDRLCLRTAVDLDRDMQAKGLAPEVASRTVERVSDEGQRRVTVNALYRRA